MRSGAKHLALNCSLHHRFCPTYQCVSVQHQQQQQHHGCKCFSDKMLPASDSFLLSHRFRIRCFKFVQFNIATSTDKRALGEEPTQSEVFSLNSWDVVESAASSHTPTLCCTFTSKVHGPLGEWQRLTPCVRGFQERWLTRTLSKCWFVVQAPSAPRSTFWKSMANSILTLWMHVREH